MQNFISKLWTDHNGAELLQFPAYTNLSEYEVEEYVNQREQPIISMEYFEKGLAPRQMIANFAKAPKPDNWRTTIAKEQLVYQKYLSSQDPVYVCEQHRTAANCKVSCTTCGKQYDCTMCGRCDCLQPSQTVVCKRCQHTQSIGIERCEECNIRLYNHVCSVCGPQIVLDGRQMTHCRKCGRCHDIQHQYCNICGACDEKTLFLELHSHMPSSVVCCVCGQVCHREAMRFRTLECGCSCCFVCLLKQNQACQAHRNDFGRLQDGCVWGGL